MAAGGVGGAGNGKTPPIGGGAGGGGGKKPPIKKAGNSDQRPQTVTPPPPNLGGLAGISGAEGGAVGGATGGRGRGLRRAAGAFGSSSSMDSAGSNTSIGGKVRGFLTRWMGGSQDDLNDPRQRMNTDHDGMTTDELKQALGSTKQALERAKQHKGEVEGIISTNPPYKHQLVKELKALNKDIKKMTQEVERLRDSVQRSSLNDEALLIVDLDLDPPVRGTVAAEIHERMIIVHRERVKLEGLRQRTQQAKDYMEKTQEKHDRTPPTRQDKRERRRQKFEQRRDIYLALLAQWRTDFDKVRALKSDLETMITDFEVQAQLAEDFERQQIGDPDEPAPFGRQRPVFRRKPEPKK